MKPAEKTVAIVKARIVSQKKIKPRYFKLCLHAPALAHKARPGQFVMLKSAEGFTPLLRRPLSIHNVSRAQIELLYEVVGQGTELLSRKKAGQFLELIGPLGAGFKVLPQKSRRIPILVCGGMGVAPLLFLAKNLKRRKGLVLIGCRTAEQILCEKEFKNEGFNVTIATDDGSRGFKGRVTALLEKQLSTIDHRLSTIYACGPKPMFKELARICKERAVPAQVSLEAHMACGIGACLGCAVETKHGYQRVCKEGPVFDIEEVVW